MTEVKEQILSGERALFKAHDLTVIDSVFADGESPLKEASNIKLLRSRFQWKYPLWYTKDIQATNCQWSENARAGVWYTENVTVENAIIDAPKNFRRCNNLVIKNASIANAEETLWHCSNVTLENVNAHGHYFALDCNNLKINNLVLHGNYSFDGVKNAEIHNATMLSKDAFWNSENITVYDSTITGEYLGWNSKNLTLINCTIESLQGMCYIENLTMINCRLINTVLAFEYSDVNAEITGNIASVFNPKSGTIKADRIGKLILEKDKIDPSKTVIKCSDISEKLDKPDFA